MKNIFITSVSGLFVGFLIHKIMRQTFNLLYTSKSFYWFDLMNLD